MDSPREPFWPWFLIGLVAAALCIAYGSGLLKEIGIG